MPLRRKTKASILRQSRKELTMDNCNLWDAFEKMNPYEKATFIDARLAWASNGALCGEVHKRLCEPLNDD